MSDICDRCGEFWRDRHRVPGWTKMTTAKARRLRNLRPNKSGDANRGRGRLQRQVRHAFEAHGDTLRHELGHA
jgi:hypothetical protein